ncbi:hypothetical protein BS17DRAFT_773550 [Gyrodon lividus]|nr:hypothetical protein BS17DRAFT_773550 [Gyrodon lividus]
MQQISCFITKVSQVRVLAWTEECKAQLTKDRLTCSLLQGLQDENEQEAMMKMSQEVAKRFFSTPFTPAQSTTGTRPYTTTSTPLTPLRSTTGMRPYT